MQRKHATLVRVLLHSITAARACTSHRIALPAGALPMMTDILVVNKFDLPHAQETKAELKSMLHLREKSDWTIPVIGTTATTFSGLEELADAVEQHDATLRGSRERIDPRARTRKVLAETLANFIEDQLMESNNPDLLEILDALQSGELDFEEAGRKVLESGLLSGERVSS